MPINVNDIAGAHPVDVPWGWFVIIAVAFTSGFILLSIAYMERRDISVVAYLLMVVLSVFAGISTALSVNQEAQDARAADLSSQIQKHYGFAVSSDSVRTLLSTSKTPVGFIHENALYTISVISDGSVVVTDSQGNLINPK